MNDMLGRQGLAEASRRLKHRAAVTGSQRLPHRIDGALLMRIERAEAHCRASLAHMVRSSRSDCSATFKISNWLRGRWRSMASRTIERSVSG
jgi:hypothetical protein